MEGSINREVSLNENTRMIKVIFCDPTLGRSQLRDAPQPQDQEEKTQSKSAETEAKRFPK